MEGVAAAAMGECLKAVELSITLLGSLCLWADRKDLRLVLPPGGQAL